MFGDVIGGILGGENVTAAETAPDSTDAAPSDIVNIEDGFKSFKRTSILT